MPLKSIDTIREGVLSQMMHLADAVRMLADADEKMGAARQSVEVAWQHWSHPPSQHGDQCDALITMNSMVRASLNEKLNEAVVQFAKLFARDVVAKDIREGTVDTPITALTGNSFMPPIRSYNDAERVWQMDRDGELWETFTEAFNEAMEKEGVEIMSPDFDNMLYGTDLRRWTLIDTDDNDPNLWMEHTNWSRLRD